MAHHTRWFHGSYRVYWHSIAASVGKIGYDVMLMMQTETGEVLEPFLLGRGASSTMPQKRNPISSEMMLAAAKIVREQH